jgi:hypothetical protein
MKAEVLGFKCLKEYTRNMKILVKPRSVARRGNQFLRHIFRRGIYFVGIDCAFRGVPYENK